ncbi:MAG: hypothetical protein L6R19_25090 [Alphaproteobacteria bacterium]|nr:hypothetical protein [Alphaproteobacteria bacterium]
MKSIKTAFGLAATAALLAVAAATPSEAFTRHEQMWSSYDPTEINGAHGGRMLPTLVTGNPFGGPQEAFAEAVVGAMRGSRGGRPTDPAVAATAPMRVLMMFNAATLTGDRLCDRRQPLAVGDAGPRAPTGGARVELVATYCRGDRPMTQVTASLDGASGPDDPRFQDFIKQVTLSLFPSRNPDMQGDGQFPD